MTKVTIIIHEERGGRRMNGRPQMARDGAAEQSTALGHRGRHGHGHRTLDAQPGSEWGHRRHGHSHNHGRHRPDAELTPAELAQRDLARQVRREVRRVLREAEAAGLNPERAARVVRRETRRSFL